jgi:hypothetical protein
VIDGAQLSAFLADRGPLLSAAEIETAFDALNRYLTVRLEDIAKKDAAAKASA